MGHLTEAQQTDVSLCWSNGQIRRWNYSSICDSDSSYLSVIYSVQYLGYNSTLPWIPTF